MVNISLPGSGARNWDTALNAALTAINGQGESNTAIINAVEQDLEALTDQVAGIQTDVAFPETIKVITVDDLPSTGIVSAHRGGGAGDATDSPIAGDGVISAYETAVSMGANILDVDCRTTADGVLVVMHDATVDRTTNGTGAVSSHTSNALPQVVPSRQAGTGWPNENVPTLDQVFRRFGGKVVITVEAKNGVPDVAPIANLIKKYGLEKSVFINTNSTTVITEIVNQGILAHLWAASGTTHVTPGIAAGASLIEIPYNSSTTTVDTLQAAQADNTKKLRWFIAGPVETRAQVTSMTAGIMGHVSDALGMTNRVTGAAPLTTSLLPALRANKRGIGWRIDGAVEISGGGLTDKTTDATPRGVYLGDFSGTMPGTYVIRYKFKVGSALPGTSGAVRMRLACTLPDKTGQDSDTDGYVVSLRGNGQLNLWSSNGSFGAGVDIGSTVAANPLVSGTEYTVRVNITPTTIQLTREDTGATVGPVANTQWRGPHHYAIFSGTGTTLNTTITDITRT